MRPAPRSSCRARKPRRQSQENRAGRVLDVISVVKREKGKINRGETTQLQPKRLVTTEGKCRVGQKHQPNKVKIFLSEAHTTAINESPVPIHSPGRTCLKSNPHPHLLYAK
jgi:hypothetical protein